MTVETFEQVLTTAEVAGGLNPAWKKFLKTKFFVPVDRAIPAEPPRYELHVAPAAADARRAIRIAELPDALEREPGAAKILMYGSEVVRKLQAGAEIHVLLSDRAFVIGLDKVDWLKAGVEAARARAAQAPAAAGAPRPAQGPLDIAALKPRSVSHPAIGLSFFVPAAWVEKRGTRSTIYTDLAVGTRVEVSGAHRPNLTLGQFMTQRLGQVGHEMPYLKQADVPYELHGEDWQGRIRGMATEFTGTFPGEKFESRYLVACIWTEGTAVSLAIRAAAADFDSQRALYTWLLGRVDIAAHAEDLYGAPSTIGAQQDGDTFTPRPFGLSLEGRIGRLRGMAWSLAVLLPLMLVAGVGAALLASQPVALVAMMAVFGVVAMWCVLRLLVMRLHDLNRSGKWVLALFGLVAVAGAIQNAMLLLVSSLLFWVLTVVIYYFMPGTDGDNDYGPPAGPNTTLVKVGAGLFVVLQLAGIYAQVQLVRTGTLPGGLRAVQTEAAPAVPAALMAFGPPDRSFTVKLPGKPREVPLPPGAREQMGEVIVHQYELAADGRMHIVQAINFRTTPPDASVLMDRLQAGVTGRDGTVVRTGPIDFDGYTGREVRVAAPGGSVRTSRFVVFNTRVASVTVIGPDDAATAAAVTATMDSFMLGPPMPDGSEN